jgi:mRNA-degrading endonuclease RelE of RelBE toxin-antitoxin system
MTRYTVVWAPDAEDELADLWIEARDRNALTRATNLVDLERSHDAGTKRVGVAEGLRALLAPPLRVLFSVDEDDRVVTVAQVKRVSLDD